MSVPITDNAPAGTREGSNTHQSSLEHVAGTTGDGNDSDDLADP